LTFKVNTYSHPPFAPNDTASSNFNPNYSNVRIWTELYTDIWNKDESLWEDESNLFNFSPVTEIGTPFSANTIYNANPLTMTVNARLTDNHFLFNGVNYGSDAALKAHTISAEKHPLKASDGSVYPGLPNLNVSDNIMYWPYSGQLVIGGSTIWTLVLNALLGTTIGIEDFVLIKSSDGTSVSGLSGSWVGDLTSIKQGEFYEVHVASGVSINLVALGKLFYKNDYIQLANNDILDSLLEPNNLSASSSEPNNILASASEPNNVPISNMVKASTIKHIYDDNFQNIEDAFSVSDKYFGKAHLSVSNSPIGASWQAA